MARAILSEPGQSSPSPGATQRKVEYHAAVNVARQFVPLLLGLRLTPPDPPAGHFPARKPPKRAARGGFNRVGGESPTVKNRAFSEEFCENFANPSIFNRLSKAGPDTNWHRSPCKIIAMAL